MFWHHHESLMASWWVGVRLVQNNYNDHPASARACMISEDCTRSLPTKAIQYYVNIYQNLV